MSVVIKVHCKVLIYIHVTWDQALPLEKNGKNEKRT